MNNRKSIVVLVIIISILAFIATLTGILTSKDFDGYQYEFQSIHGQIVDIFGKGVYQHMSSDVAIQGIAQDYVTLYISIPLLLFSLFLTRKNRLKSKMLLAGTLSYFFLTYLFYMNMAMYNSLFLIYIILTGTTFFALTLTLLSIDVNSLPLMYRSNTPVKFMGGFLIFTASIIALLWLSILVPPLIDNSIIPLSVEHYTTLTVQGFDLSLFHPITFISGYLLIKKNKFGYLLSPVMLVFLSLLMIALVAKIIAISLSGGNVMPAVIIVPVIAIIALVSAFLIFKNITNTKENEQLQQSTQ